MNTTILSLIVSFLLHFVHSSQSPLGESDVLDLEQRGGYGAMGEQSDSDDEEEFQELQDDGKFTTDFFRVIAGYSHSPNVLGTLSRVSQKARSACAQERIQHCEKTSEELRRKYHALDKSSIPILDAESFGDLQMQILRDIKQKHYQVGEKWTGIITETNTPFLAFILTLKGFEQAACGRYYMLERNVIITLLFKGVIEVNYYFYDLRLDPFWMTNPLGSLSVKFTKFDAEQQNKWVSIGYVNKLIRAFRANNQNYEWPIGDGKIYKIRKESVRRGMFGKLDRISISRKQFVSRCTFVWFIAAMLVTAICLYLKKPGEDLVMLTLVFWFLHFLGITCYNFGNQ